VYETWWPIFVIIVVYFIFFGVWLGAKENALLNERSILCWCISALVISIFFDILYLTIGILLVMTFFATYLIASTKEENDYAVAYALLLTLLGISVLGFFSEMLILTYICIGIILFIVTIILLDRRRN